MEEDNPNEERSDNEENENFSDNVSSNEDPNNNETISDSTNNSNSGNQTSSLGSNPWKISTFVLGAIFLVFVLIGGVFGGLGFTGSTTNNNTSITGNAVSSNAVISSGDIMSEDKVKDKVLNFINSQLPSGKKAEVKNIKKDSGLYNLTVSFQGRDMPIYTTVDGNNLVQGVMSFKQIEKQQEASQNQQDQSSQNQQQEVPKSDNPKVDLFIMSYCPYGTQAQKGILPAFEALGDKVDSNIRFVNYLMHGEKEGRENTRQYCIQKEQESKFMDYMTCFLDSGESEPCLEESDVDEEELQSCINETNEEYNVTELIEDESSYRGGRYPQYNVENDLNNKYSVQGSPTLIINGEQVRPSSRSPAAYLDIICQAFTEDAKPSVCEEANLETSAYPPKFGYDTSASSSSSGSQCG